MRAFFYQEQWQQLQKSPTTKEIESLAQRIASSFVDRYYYSDEYNRDYIHLLCEMATHFKESELNQIAARVLFGTVIERLCDDFEELQTETYNRLICQVVNFLCAHPEGQEIKSKLSDFELPTEELLYERIENIRLNPDFQLQSSIKPEKILVLSRVTVGADVAITSVICQRVSKFYPEADIIVFGDAKLKQVFGPGSDLTVHDLSYSRRGGLLERFLVWLELLKEIRAHIAGLSPSQFLLIDPDSRLTQLGVLPLVPLQNYCFFNSRGKKGYSVTASVSELTNLWLDNILAKNEFCYPSVWPESEKLKQAKKLRKAIDPEDLATVVTLNFGVGGNTRKRVDGSFETELVQSLLQQPNIRLILDLGFGEEEQNRAKAIIRCVEQQGIPVQTLDFGELEDAKPDSRLLGINCTVGEITALIALSDEFIGYDSACQHIAAAQKVKTYTVFAGTTNVRFIRRWQACGSAASEIIFVDTISRDSHIDNTDIIGRLLDLRLT